MDFWWVVRGVFIDEYVHMLHGSLWRLETIQASISVSVCVLIFSQLIDSVTANDRTKNKLAIVGVIQRPSFSSSEKNFDGANGSFGKGETMRSFQTTQIPNTNPEIDYGYTSLTPMPVPKTHFQYSEHCNTRSIAPQICTLRRHGWIGTRYGTIQPCIATTPIQHRSAEQPSLREIAIPDTLMHTEPWQGIRTHKGHIQRDRIETN